MIRLSWLTLAAGDLSGWLNTRRFPETMPTFIFPFLARICNTTTGNQPFFESSKSSKQREVCAGLQRSVGHGSRPRDL
jgi:hypothetical protein